MTPTRIDASRSAGHDLPDRSFVAASPVTFSTQQATVSGRMPGETRRTLGAISGIDHERADGNGDYGGHVPCFRETLS